MDIVLNDFQRSLGRALGESVTLEVSIEETGLAAFIDRPQFEAALLNICINSRDAMTSNGQIMLKIFSSSSNNGDAPLVRNAQGSNEDLVCVQISDNGSGIEPGLLSKITEPYFTTKDIGEGSGLGLSSVVGFVDQSGGSFRIFSTLGGAPVWNSSCHAAAMRSLAKKNPANPDREPWERRVRFRPLDASFGGGRAFKLVSYTTSGYGR